MRFLMLVLVVVVAMGPGQAWAAGTQAVVKRSVVSEPTTKDPIFDLDEDDSSTQGY